MENCLAVRIASGIVNGTTNKLSCVQPFYNPADTHEYVNKSIAYQHYGEPWNYRHWGGVHTGNTSSPLGPSRQKEGEGKEQGVKGNWCP
jgi:hypothetical protein